ncbi:MAG: hypothetical protein AB7O96_04555 [Pseudobdellovibrionaceae bacterium]
MIYSITLRSEKNKDCTLQFKLFDSTVIRKFSELTKKALSTKAAPSRVNFYHELTQEEVAEKTKEINQCVDQIHDYYKKSFLEKVDLAGDLPSKLNSLHMEFHLFEDNHMEDYPIHPVFHQINVLIHQVENALLFFKYGRGLPHFVFALDPSERFELTDEECKELTMQRKFGDLILSYDTIGKSLPQAFTSRDLQLIERQLIRPKSTIGTEVSCIFPKHVIDEEEEKRRYNLYYEWCEKNEVTKYGYDFRSPRHRMGNIRLGELIGKWDQDRVRSLLKDAKLSKVELFDV